MPSLRIPHQLTNISQEMRRMMFLTKQNRTSRRANWYQLETRIFTLREVQHRFERKRPKQAHTSTRFRNWPTLATIIPRSTSRPSQSSRSFTRAPALASTSRERHTAIAPANQRAKKSSPLHLRVSRLSTSKSKSNITAHLSLKSAFTRASRQTSTISRLSIASCT